MCTCLSVYHMNTVPPKKPEKDILSPAKGFIDGCELSCGC